jgi:hypothetical protein
MKVSGGGDSVVKPGHGLRESRDSLDVGLFPGTEGPKQIAPRRKT